MAIRIPADSSFEGLSLEELNIGQTPFHEFKPDSIHFYLSVYHDFLQVSFDTLSKKVRNKKDLTKLSLLQEIKKFTLMPEDCCLEISFDMPLNPIDLTKGSLRLFSPQDSTYHEVQSGISIFNNTLRLSLIHI